MEPEIGGWFSSFEMPESTARAVHEEKQKKYMTRLEKQPNGNFIVYWRGLTKVEQQDRKRQKNMMKNIV